MGLGVFLGTINVFYRDVEHTIQVLIQFWFWLTPIVYVAQVIPPSAAALLSFNPLWPLIDSLHVIFLERQFPCWDQLLYPAVLSIALAFLGIFVFGRLQGEIVDEL